MSDLDENIRDILQETDITEHLDYVISAIKQAFKEAGYIEPYSNEHYQAANDAMNNAEPLMTGQEWYERFKEELERQGPPTLELRMAYPEEIEANVLNAARRAAGLDADVHS